MSITTLFLAVIASIVVWFFLQQRLAAKNRDRKSVV